MPAPGIDENVWTNGLQRQINHKVHFEFGAFLEPQVILPDHAFGDHLDLHGQAFIINKTRWQKPIEIRANLIGKGIGNSSVERGW